MSKQIMITLEQAEWCDPCSRDWNKLLKANGGELADFNTPFPLSTLLDINGFGDTIRLFRCLPEHKSVFEKFAISCVKKASVHIDDERVHNCINIIEKYLKGEATLDELLAAYEGAENASHDPDAYDTVAFIVARVATYVVRDAAYEYYYDAVRAAARIAVDTATDATTERQNQIEYLRKLLDGEV